MKGDKAIISPSQQLKQNPQSDFSIEAYEEQLRQLFQRMTIQKQGEMERQYLRGLGDSGGAQRRSHQAPDNTPVQRNRKNGLHARKVVRSISTRKRLDFTKRESMPGDSELFGSTCSIKRKSGHQEVPTILKEQSNKLLRNKSILSKFMPHKDKSTFIRKIITKQKVISVRQGAGGSQNLAFSKQSTFIKSQTSTKKAGNGATSSSGEEDRQSELAEEGSDFEEEQDLVALNQRHSIKNRSMMVMYPDALIRAIWDISLFILIVYQGFFLPMRIAFELPATDFLFHLDIVIDVMFIFDIVLNFNTGFYQRGQLVMKRELIVKDYLQMWFWIDLISSTPYTWILALSQGIGLREIEADDNLSGALANTPQLLKLLKIAKLLKMLKLLRVVKIKRILMKFEEYIVTDSMALVATFVNITMKIVIIAHYMGCFFYYFGMDDLRANNKGWLVEKQLIDEDFPTKYITSLYWAFTTMSAVGYGEIVPATKDERTYAMAAMIMSCGIFAYTVNSIGNIVSRYNQMQSQFRERMMYVNQFMVTKDMPQELKMKVRRYLDYIFESKKEIKVDESEVFKLLNEGLRDKIQMELRGTILQQLLFIQNFGLDFLSELTQYFKKVTYVADDFLFMEKDKAESIFYIIQGKIAMIHKQSHTFITSLNKEKYFGELGFLMDKPRLLSAKARDFTEVYVIQKSDFDSISSNYLQAIQAIRQIKDALDNNNYSLLKTRCYLCNSELHLALGCKKYSRWRGNLMRLFVSKQMNSKSKTFNLNREADGPINNNDPLAADNNEGLITRGYFVYAEENHDDWQKHPPSADSADNIEIKMQLLRQNVKESHVMLDSHLIENIFEYPKETKNYLFELKQEEMISQLPSHAQDASGDSSFLSSPAKRPTLARLSAGTASDVSPLNRFSLQSGYEGDPTAQKPPGFGQRPPFHARPRAPAEGIVPKSILPVANQFSKGRGFTEAAPEVKERSEGSDGPSARSWFKKPQLEIKLRDIIEEEKECNSQGESYQSSMSKAESGPVRSKSLNQTLNPIFMNQKSESKPKNKAIQKLESSQSQLPSFSATEANENDHNLIKHSQTEEVTATREQIRSRLPSQQWLDNEILFKDNNDVPPSLGTPPRQDAAAKEIRSDKTLITDRKDESRAQKQAGEAPAQKLAGLKTVQKNSSTSEPKKHDLQEEKSDVDESKNREKLGPRRHSIGDPGGKDSMVNQYPNIQPKNYNFSNYRQKGNIHKKTNNQSKSFDTKKDLGERNNQRKNKKQTQKFHHSTRSKFHSNSPLVSRIDKGSRDDSKERRSMQYVDTPGRDGEQSYPQSYSSSYVINAQKEALRIFTTSVNNDPRTKSASAQPTADQAHTLDGVQRNIRITEEDEASARLNRIVEEAKSRETHSKDIESENRSSPAKLREFTDSSNPIHLFSEDFSIRSSLRDIESQVQRAQAMHMTSIASVEAQSQGQLSAAVEKKVPIMSNRNISSERMGLRHGQTSRAKKDKHEQHENKIKKQQLLSSTSHLTISSSD